MHWKTDIRGQIEFNPEPHMVWCQFDSLYGRFEEAQLVCGFFLAMNAKHEI
jgi:hypothetical protein